MFIFFPMTPNYQVHLPYQIFYLFFSADPSCSPNGGCNVLGTPQGPPQFKKLSLYIEAIFG